MDIFSLSAPRGALAIFLKHEFAIILGKCLCMIFIMLKYKNIFSNHEQQLKNSEFLDTQVPEYNYVLAQSSNAE